MVDVRSKWDRRWQERAAADGQPDAWLQRITPLLVPGRTLDVACGSGRNALYLAARGFSVTAIDISGVALAQLRERATQAGLAIDTRRLDLEQNPVLPAGPFDLLLDFYYLHRPVLAPLLGRVAAGGMAVVRTFSSAGDFPAGSVAPEMVLRPGELLHIFSGWDIVLHEEGLEPSRKGGSLAGIVARKPGEKHPSVEKGNI